MLDLVPRDPAPQEIAPISKTVLARQESTAIADLQAYYSRDRNGFSKFSEELFHNAPMIHLVGIIMVPMFVLVGTGPSPAPGASIGFLTAAGALAASYGSMLFSSVRTKLRNRKALVPAMAEAKDLEGELAGWLKRDYELSLDARSLCYLAQMLLWPGEEKLDSTQVWSFRTASGASFEARIVQCEDGSLELHRPSVAELGEESLIQPLKKAIDR